MSKYYQFIDKNIDDAKKRLQEQLDGLHSKEQRQRVLTRYYSIIHPYIKDLRAMDKGTLDEAPTAAAELELLEKFMEQLHISRNEADAQELESFMERVIAPLSKSLKPRRPAAICMANYLMAELATVFLPWMQIMATDEGSTDTQYAQTDSAINEQRVIIARSALIKEFDLKNPADIIDVNEIFDDVALLFWHIFAV